jgi:hypothetical protein
MAIHRGSFGLAHAPHGAYVRWDLGAGPQPASHHLHRTVRRGAPPFYSKVSGRKGSQEQKSALLKPSQHTETAV